jgi:GAF domain-containing protein
MKLVSGQGLPGQVWESGGPVTIRDLVAAANFPRSALALTTGLRSGHAVPVRHTGELVGVLEVFSSEARGIGAGASEALAAIGQMVGLAWRR